MTAPPSASPSPRSARGRTPIVAVVGRPNVGKSTLFNRYAGHPRALVADEPGLTRDRIVEEIEVAGRRVLLVDTAGLDPDAEDALGAAVQRQARSAVDEADAILFVVDGKAGLLPEDAEIARTLRRADKPLALAVNKIDVPAHRERVHEFHALGLGEPHAISAEHGTNAWDALEELVARLPAETEEPDAPDDGAIRVAVVGRPNVGKSSLVNRLAGADRVVVSEVAGTTRDAIDIRIERAEAEGDEPAALVLVDTAGLRRAAKRSEHVERGSALMTTRSLERAEVALIVIDASEGVGDQDARIASLVVESGCAAIIVLNKWDLVDAEQAERVRGEVARALRFAPDFPMVALSAKTGARAPRVWPAIARVHAAAGRRVATGELNRWLEETVVKHEPSMARRGSRRRPIKFFYATQTGTHPPTFVLFCTEPRAVLPSYVRFLENQLRASFDFAGTPVRLRLRSRGRGD
ncbi:MAG: ribosome biogenesis GTPase Der [Myxococcota bacterium]|nr:ribosome biogenesis GTPase Der [Myxococcales bacterium]